MQVSAIISGHVIESWPGLETELVREGTRKALRVLVRPDLKGAKMQRTFGIARPVNGRPWWGYQWWCRLTRWLQGKGVPLPRTLTSVVNTWEVTWQYTDVHVPDDVQGRILTQIASLYEDGIKPSKIVCGMAAMMGLRKSEDVFWGATEPATMYSEGLPVQLSRWLTDDAVVVV